MFKKITQKVKSKKIYIKKAIALFISLTILLIPFEIMGVRPERKYAIIKEARAQVATDVIVPWPGSTSLPSGWTRESTLDTYYVKGTTSDPSGTPGGAATHSHNSPTHIHSIPDHTHTDTTGGSTGGTPVTDQAGGDVVDVNHTHQYTSGSLTGITDNDPQSANLDSASNDPPYKEVIWIKSQGTAEIPDTAYAFYKSDTLPGSWTRVEGDTFLKGSSAGVGGGGTGGSSDSHFHTDTGHTHTEAVHGHGLGTGTLGPSSATRDGKAGTGYSTDTHTHNITNITTTAATEQSDSTATVGTGDAQPPFKKLNIIQNGTGGGDTPNSAIALWLGTVASIPGGWVICDGNNGTPNMSAYFVKGANANGESDVVTGGGTSHSHGTGNTHSHAINAHNHTATVQQDQDAGETTFKTGTNADTVDHAHTLTLTGGSGTTGTATITADTSTDETQPPFMEAVFVMYQPTTLTQNDWRLYVDNDALNPAEVWGAPDLGENEALYAVPPGNDPIDVADEIRIRISIAVSQSALASGSKAFIFQYAESNDCDSVSSWTDVDIAAGGGTWRYAASTVTDNTTLTSFLIGVSDVYGRYNKSDPTSTNPNAVTSGQDMEWDFHVEYNGSAEAHTYCFRIAESDAGSPVALDAYNVDSYPMIDVRPSLSDLMRHGNFFTTFVERGFFWAD